MSDVPNTGGWVVRNPDGSHTVRPYHVPLSGDVFILGAHIGQFPPGASIFEDPPGTGGGTGGPQIGGNPASKPSISKAQPSQPNPPAGSGLNKNAGNTRVGPVTGPEGPPPPEGCDPAMSTVVDRGQQTSGEFRIEDTLAQPITVGMTPLPIYDSADILGKPTFTIEAFLEHDIETGRTTIYHPGSGPGLLVFHPGELEDYHLYGSGVTPGSAWPADLSKGTVLLHNDLSGSGGVDVACINFAAGIPLRDSVNPGLGIYFEMTSQAAGAATIYEVNATDPAGVDSLLGHMRFNTAVDLGQYTDAIRDTLSPRAGSLIWNTENTAPQVFDGSVWADILTGATAGDVVGPAGATNNAIARFDTATGKLIQDSAILVSDLSANKVTMDLAAAATATDFCLAAGAGSGAASGGADLDLRGGQAGTSGAGGDVFLIGGGAAGGAGGTVTIEAGSGTSDGALNLGAANTNLITLGDSGSTYNIQGEDSFINAFIAGATARTPDLDDTFPFREDVANGGTSTFLDIYSLIDSLSAGSLDIALTDKLAAFTAVDGGAVSTTPNSILRTIHNTLASTVLINANEIPFIQTNAGNAIKHITWQNFKAMIRRDVTTSRIKLADQTYTSDTTLNNETALVFTLEAGEIYVINYHMMLVSSTLPDFKFDFAGGTATFSLFDYDWTRHHSIGSETGAFVTSEATVVPVVSPRWTNPVLDISVSLTTILGGTLIFRHAQNTSNAATTGVLTGSHAVLHRVSS